MKFIFTFFILTGVFVILPSLNTSVFSKYHRSTNLNTASSVNPPAAKTGAPGEGNCTGCHAGTVQAATGTIDISFSGVSNEYVVGQTYTITISIATGTKNGFEATILDASNVKAGSFTSGTNYGVTTSAGRQYVRQTVSVGVTSWSISWTAPATDMGDLTMYYTFNKSNDGGNSIGDIIYMGQFTISSAVFNTITPYEQTSNDIIIQYNANQSSINYSYCLHEPSNIILQVTDLSGRLIVEQNLGIQLSGKYGQTIQTDFSKVNGICLVSLFIDNQVFTRKVFIP